MNGIIGFAEFLVDGKPGTLNPKQKEYLQDILNSGKAPAPADQRHTRPGQGRGPARWNLIPERFSLREARRGSLRRYQCRSRRRRASRSQMNVAPEIGDVTLDQQKFKQILYNLLSNAIKFNDDGGKVEIRAAHARYEPLQVGGPG